MIRYRAMAVAAALSCALPHAAAAAAPGGAADDGISAEAREHFQAGVNLLMDPDGARHEDAYRQFHAAYAASHSPRILGNIGLCALKLERDGEAIDAYSRYLSEVPDIEPVEREQIKRDLATLRAGLVRVAIAVEGVNATVIDTRYPARGAPVTNVYALQRGSAVLGLRPGRHALRARSAAGESPPWEIDAAPGTAATWRFEIVPPTQSAVAAAPPASSKPRTVPWLVVATGGGLLAASAITGGIALSKANNLERACPSGTCPASVNVDEERASTQSLVRATDGLLIGGALVAGAGAAWLLLSSPSRAEPRVACGPRGCSAGIVGSF